VQITRQRISRLVDFGWHVWLALVVVMALLPHYLICLSVLFLPGGRMYGGSAGLAKNNFFFPSLSSWDCVLAMQKIIPTLQFIFFRFSPFFYLQFFLFTLIISNWILFFISSLFILFLKFTFKFDSHSFNYYLFCFKSFSWLICFL